VPVQNSEPPCLVKTGQGDTVLYHNKYLYSKYAPDDTVRRVISALTVLPGTLVLCCSPCLCYGLPELMASLPEECIALGCETDQSLYQFSQLYAAVITSQYPRFHMLSPAELPDLPLLINERNAHISDGTLLPPPGTIRRVIRIDLSAGIQFKSNFYHSLDIACEQAVGQFWKNRIILVKLGRCFSRNLFRNIARLPSSLTAEKLFHTIAKPIIVCGAGESLEQAVHAVQSYPGLFYLLAVDAALPSLLAYSIIPDAVVCEEAQVVIADAFIGSAGSRITVFAGITSWPHSTDATNGNAVYFASCYDNTLFFDHLKQSGILPPVLPPLGSVGLTATELALQLRRGKSIPVYITGLDFSYTVGTTHAHGTPAHLKRLVSSDRLHPVENYSAAFSYGSESVKGKKGKQVITTAALSGYAAEFRGFFGKTENLYDATYTGLPLGIPYKDIQPQTNILQICQTTILQKKTLITTEAVYSFYNSEKKALAELKNILINGQNITEPTRNKRITALLEGRDYLYLHFPDGLFPSVEPQFLKRIRSEIDFFLKDIAAGEQILATSE
jgi:hypothetical protein